MNCPECGTGGMHKMDCGTGSSGTNPLYRSLRGSLYRMRNAETPEEYETAAGKAYDAFTALDEALKAGAELPVEWLNPADPG